MCIMWPHMRVFISKVIMIYLLFYICATSIYDIVTVNDLTCVQNTNFWVLGFIIKGSTFKHFVVCSTFGFTCVYYIYIGGIYISYIICKYLKVLSSRKTEIVKNNPYPCNTF